MGSRLHLPPDAWFSPLCWARLRDQLYALSRIERYAQLQVGTTTDVVDVYRKDGCGAKQPHAVASSLGHGRHVPEGVIDDPAAE